MIRRLKDQVLPDLPAKRRTLLPLEPEGKAKKLIQEQLKKQLEAKKSLRKAKALERKNKELFSNDIQKLRAVAEVAFEDIARIRHELAVLKIPQVVEYVQNAAESHPVIVFAHHKDVVRGIADGLEGLRVATITGDDDTEARQAAVEQFQAGKLDALVCSIKAAGVGLTMTRSSHVIFAELDWTPGWMQQAEDRAHRIGQQNSVQVDWLVLDGSLEAKMAKTLKAKMAVTSAATGDHSEPEESTSDSPAPAVALITEEDFARAKENEEKEATKMQAEHAAKEEEEKIKATVRAGRYAVEIDGVTKLVNLKLSYKGNFYAKISGGHIDYFLGEKAAKALASLTPVEREQARFRYGLLTGHCCKCGRELTDSLSKALGIGPECGAELHAQHQQKEAA